jgi:hypothetical protein
LHRDRTQDSVHLRCKAGSQLEPIFGDGSKVRDLEVRMSASSVHVRAVAERGSIFLQALRDQHTEDHHHELESEEAGKSSRSTALGRAVPAAPQFQ